MQIFTSNFFTNTLQGKTAEQILRKCVHCGFCTATCPTYQILGDELDGPRGRIYLIKSMLEGSDVTKKTQLHLDRCLSCLSCETTCPSGVEYGHLLDIGRHELEKKVNRNFLEKIYRYTILQIFPYRERFRVLFKLFLFFCFLLPASITNIFYKKRDNIKSKNIEIKINNHKNRVVILSGCVQSSLAPNINLATKKILARLGVRVYEVNEEQCCGAMSYHLNNESQAFAFMRSNVEILHSFINSNDIEAIISTASGCGKHIKEYSYLFKEDEHYLNKAKEISIITKDIAEYIINLNLKKLINKKKIPKAIVYQSPCSLQHGQKANGLVEKMLTELGYKLPKIKEDYLCCGSAGTYSMLQKKISNELRDRKLENLLATEPEVIITANIGCMEHLRQKTKVPVRHWVEEVARILD